MNENWWMNGVTDICSSFQVDLSCLVDGELDESAATRAMAHLETCGSCSEFFEGTRLQLELHRDIANPVQLAERYAVLLGDRTGEPDGPELVHRLATILYQIGKAYVLAEIRPERTRVFEEAVEVEETRARGRGFVDGVLEGDRDGTSGVDQVDWTSARGLLNGKLSKVEGALEKGLRLLNEALAIDEAHEEARLYLGFAQLQLEKPLRAQREFKRVFDSALDEGNRGHAAVQLALMEAAEGEYRRAIAFLRCVTMSGLPELDERFFFVRFNIAMYYAHLLQRERSIAAFRELLDRHPESVGEVAGFFAGSPKLRATIDAQDGFAVQLMNTCPELFRDPSVGAEVSQ
jgi:tetratricopeptide (TPR) repeat protein